jgi:hypothetical protein
LSSYINREFTTCVKKCILMLFLSVLNMCFCFKQLEMNFLKQLKFLLFIKKWKYLSNCFRVCLGLYVLLVTVGNCLEKPSETIHSYILQSFEFWWEHFFWRAYMLASRNSLWCIYMSRACFIRICTLWSLVDIRLISKILHITTLLPPVNFNQYICDFFHQSTHYGGKQR